MNGPDGKKFVWGKVLEVIEVGQYQIVKAVAKEEFDGSDFPTYYPYVDGEDTNNHADSLDGALLLAIAHNRVSDPEADAMARAAAKLLNVCD